MVHSRSWVTQGTHTKGLQSLSIHLVSEKKSLYSAAQSRRWLLLIWACQRFWSLPRALSWCFRLIHLGNDAA